MPGPEEHPAPLPPLIPDAGFYSLNQSGIPHRADKVRARPRGVRIVDGYKERHRQDDQEATVVYDVPFSTRFAFVDWCLGFATPGVGPAPAVKIDAPDPKNGGLRQVSISLNSLSRTIPDQHYRRPFLYAADCDLIQPLGAWVDDPLAFVQDKNGLADVTAVDEGNRLMLVQGPAYVERKGDGSFRDGLARYAVTYRPRPYEIRTDQELAALSLGETGQFAEMARHVQWETSYAVTGLPINRVIGQQLKFALGPYASQVIPEAGVLVLPSQQLHVTWHDVPDPPLDAIDALLGTVNATEFGLPRAMTGREKFQPESLLFQAPMIKRTRGVTGRVTHRVTFVLDHKPQGWNCFPAPDGRFYRALIGGVNGTPVYRSQEFGYMFTVPVPVRYQ